MASRAAIGQGSGRRGNGTNSPQRDAMRVVFVTHCQSAVPFWPVVANGARDAAADLAAATG
jgi:hypothetical protein